MWGDGCGRIVGERGLIAQMMMVQYLDQVNAFLKVARYIHSISETVFSLCACALPWDTKQVRAAFPVRIR